VTFELLRVRFRFRAGGRVRFPAGLAGNVLRGGFGAQFRRLACVPECVDPAACPRRPVCPYARVFEPRAARGEGPSGLSDWPRPFVFRAAHLDGRTFEAGQPFHFDVHLFELAPPAGGEPALPYFVRALERLAAEGLGPGRGRAELLAAEPLRVALDLSAGREPVSGLKIRFVTPTELKSGDQLARTPEFPILFQRLRDRLSTLRALYGPGPLAIDFRAMGERAAAVKLTRADLRSIAAERRSSRTGQVHPLGGFCGEAEYAGELGEFVPYLEAGQWVGVGRQTVWGKGEIRVIRG